MDDKTLLRIDSLLKHIDIVLNDTKDLTIDELRQHDLLLRATCFSIAQIGETMNQLYNTLGDKYFNLPWIGARRMRNVIVHDYGNADVEQVYSTIHNDLPSLKVSFITIKNDIEFNTLITERLVLRKVNIKDIEPMFNNWARDPDVTKYVTWLPHQNIGITEMIVKEWIKEDKNPRTIRYMITIKGDNEPIGSIDVVDYVNGVPEIGYCLSKKHWNKGYMTEACKALIEYIFNIGFTKIVIEADVRNIGSNKVIKKCGFSFTHKEEKEHCSQFKPEPIAVNWYEIKK